MSSSFKAHYWAIPCQQPWAALAAQGSKTILARTYKTSYRGPLAIVASKTVDQRAYRKIVTPLETRFDVRGVILALAELVEVRPMVKSDEIEALCEFDPRFYAYCLEDIKPVKRQPIKAAQGLWKPKQQAPLTYL